MQEQNLSVGTTLKVVGKMMADTLTRSQRDSRGIGHARDYCVVYVKDGVANVASPVGCHTRFEVNAPDGQYDITQDGFLRPIMQPILGPMNTPLDFPYDPEVIRPAFERLKPLCQIQTALINELLIFVRSARDAKEFIMIEKNGMGFSRSNEIYIEYPFGAPRTLKMSPLFLEVAFTDALRFPMIEMYQEIRPGDLESKEGPQLPLVIGYGWKNCTLIKPLGEHERFY